MKVERIQFYKQGFIQYLMDESSEIQMDKYHFIASWSEHWDLDALDLKSRFEKTFENPFSTNLWGGSNQSMKSEMLRMLDQDKEFIRLSFENLFQEGKDLGLRMDRFLHHLDEAYKEIKRKDLKAIHHEHNRSNSMLYLIGAFPTAYCLHDYATFKEMMIRLESRTIPMEIEIERYFKSMRAIYKILTKDDPTLEQVLAMRCALYSIPYQSNLLVMNDFAHYVANQ